MQFKSKVASLKIKKCYASLRFWVNSAIQQTREVNEGTLAGFLGSSPSWLILGQITSLYGDYVSATARETIFQSKYFPPTPSEDEKKMWGPKVLSLEYYILRHVGGQEQMARKHSYLVTCCFHKMTLVAHPEFLIHRLSIHKRQLEAARRLNANNQVFTRFGHFWLLVLSK